MRIGSALPLALNISLALVLFHSVAQAQNPSQYDTSWLTNGNNPYYANLINSGLMPIPTSPNAPASNQMIVNTPGTISASTVLADGKTTVGDVMNAILPQGSTNNPLGLFGPNFATIIATDIAIGGIQVNSEGIAVALLPIGPVNPVTGVQSFTWAPVAATGPALPANIAALLDASSTTGNGGLLSGQPNGPLTNLPDLTSGQAAASIYNNYGIMGYNSSVAQNAPGSNLSADQLAMLHNIAPPGQDDCNNDGKGGHVTINNGAVTLTDNGDGTSTEVIPYMDACTGVAGNTTFVVENSTGQAVSSQGSASAASAPTPSVAGQSPLVFGLPIGVAANSPAMSQADALSAGMPGQDVEIPDQVVGNVGKFVKGVFIPSDSDPYGLNPAKQTITFTTLPVSEASAPGSLLSLDGATGGTGAANQPVRVVDPLKSPAPGVKASSPIIMGVPSEAALP